MENTSIFTTGAFLHPVQMNDSEGNKRWFWAVSAFEEDSYKGGFICNPIATADAQAGLLIEDTDDK
jgi:hypothetical protein